MPWSVATLTERWWDYLHGYATGRFRRFFPEDPPEPASQGCRSGQARARVAVQEETGIEGSSLTAKGF
jgi:hypothetical protein